MWGCMGLRLCTLIGFASKCSYQFWGLFDHSQRQFMLGGHLADKESAFHSKRVVAVRTGGIDTIFLAESAIFYPYTLHGVFGKAISWCVVTVC